MEDVLTVVEFDENLFDEHANVEWIGEVSRAPPSKSKQGSSRRKVKDIKFRPFKCSLCSMAFPQSAGLSRHRKMAHANYRWVNGEHMLVSVEDKSGADCTSCQKQVLRETLRRGLSVLTKEELLEEFRFVTSYVAEIRDQLLRIEIVL